MFPSQAKIEHTVHVPLFSAVSANIQNSKWREGRYAPLLNLMETTKAPAMLYAVQDSAPSEYTDMTSMFPFSARLFDEGIKSRSNFDPLIHSARSTASFLDLVLYWNTLKK